MLNTYTTLSSDTFTQASTTPNTSVWANDPANGVSACQVIGNELEPTASESIAINIGAIWNPNAQWAQVQIDDLNYITNQEAAVLLVMNRGASADNAYVIEVDGPLGAN